MRLPQADKLQENIKVARTWIDEIDPEWISLQFVLFSFHIKGLPFNLNKALALLGKRRWHIMFHELWVGAANKTTTKLLVWGYVQRQIIKGIVRALKPEILHTQTKLYQMELLEYGLRAKYLPLFSNIPVHSTVIPNKAAATDKKNIRFVIFGSIHPDAPVESFTNELANYAKKHNAEITLNIIGRSGEQQKLWETIWSQKGLNVVVLGERSPESISEIMSTSSIGISTTPIYLAEKSGSIAAMIAHGLPVVCVSKAFKVRTRTKVTFPGGLMEYKSGILEDYLNGDWGGPIIHTVADVSREFVNSLVVKEEMENSSII
jgi:hypothetical protein